MLIAKVKQVVDPLSGKRLPFSLGEKIEVKHIEMGQSYTIITLKDYDGWFNSVVFDFYENGRKKDIYKSRKYNPYF